MPGGSDSLQRGWGGDVAVFENRQPVTAIKFITKVHCLFYCLALSSAGAEAE